VRTSALFGAKNFRIFEIYGCGQGGRCQFFAIIVEGFYGLFITRLNRVTNFALLRASLQ